MLDKKDKIISIINEFNNLSISESDGSSIIIKHINKPLVLRVFLLKSTATIRTNHNSCWKHITTLKKFKEAVIWMCKK